MIWVAMIVLLTLPAGIWRLLRGPTVADRILAVQMLGTSAIAVLLIMAQGLQAPVWRDIALVLALLAAVLTIAMVQLFRRADPDAEQNRKSGRLGHDSNSL